MPIGIIGDMHYVETLPYAEAFNDGRQGEWSRMESAIRDYVKGCSDVIFLGDQFDAKNNPSEVITKFTKFLESLEGSPEVHILAGNHEKRANGTSALDYLRHVKNPKWHVYTDVTQVAMANGKTATFLPYMFRQEFSARDDAELTKMILELPWMEKGDYLFTHHALSGTFCDGGLVDLFHEAILPRKILEERFWRIFAGHIHTPYEYGKTVVVGSTFTACVGEAKKYVWQLDADNELTRIALPVLPIKKVMWDGVAEKPVVEENCITKVFCVSGSDSRWVPIEKEGVVRETYQVEQRRGMHEVEDLEALDIPKLLKLYAQAQKKEIGSLVKSLDLL